MLLLLLLLMLLLLLLLLLLFVTAVTTLKVDGGAAPAKTAGGAATPAKPPGGAAAPAKKSVSKELRLLTASVFTSPVRGGQKESGYCNFFFITSIFIYHLH